MNAKSAKIVRAYVNQIRSEGDAVILKDVKRRVEELPKAERGPVIAAMAQYLQDIRAHDPSAPTNRELRGQGKARLIPVQGRRFNSPVLQMLANLLGIGGAR